MPDGARTDNSTDGTQAHFAFEQLSSADAFDLYTDHIRTVFGLPLDFIRRKTENPTKFFADAQLVRLGDASVGYITSEDYSARMPMNERARETVSFVFLEDGVTGIGQDGRSAILRPGECFYFDTARAANFHFFSRFRQEVLHLPKSALERFLPGLSLSTAEAIPCRGSLAMVRSLVRTAVHDAASWGATSPDLQCLIDTLVSLVASGIAEGLRERVNAPLSTGALRLLAERYLGAHLGDASLRAQNVAEACGISERKLYEVFAEGVMTTLWKMRLERAREMLLSPWEQNATVAEIGYACGFKSAAHFSTRFRSAFDETPTHFRQNAVAGRTSVNREYRYSSGTIKNP